MTTSYRSFIALRYLRSKRKEVFISIITVMSVLGVALSVMVLNIVLAVMTGFEAELQSKLVDASSHITVRSYFGGVKNYHEIIAKLGAVEGVTGAYPYTYNQAMLTTSGGARGLLIRGVAEDSVPLGKLASMMPESDKAELLNSTAEVPLIRPDGVPDKIKLPSLIVGEALASTLAITADNPVTLFSPEMTSSPQGLIPKMRRFAVVGRYKSGLIEYENGMAYMGIKSAQAFFGLGDTVTGVEVSVDQLMNAPKIAKQIIEQLKDSEVGLEVTDWTKQNQPLWEAIRLEKRVYFIVLLLLVLVASFSIISTLVMVVMEKGKDIAILKTMGATDRGIKSIFLIQGGIIGFAGVALGTILGVVGCLMFRHYGFKIDERVFSLSKVPVKMEYLNFIAVAVAGLIITASAGIYPAIRAARLRPADALRFE